MREVFEWIWFIVNIILGYDGEVAEDPFLIVCPVLKSGPGTMYLYCKSHIYLYW